MQHVDDQLVARCKGLMNENVALRTQVATDHGMLESLHQKFSAESNARQESERRLQGQVNWLVQKVNSFPFLAPCASNVDVAVNLQSGHAPRTSVAGGVPSVEPKISQPMGGGGFAFSRPAGLAQSAGLSGSTVGIGILELEPLETGNPSGVDCFDGFLELEPEPGVTRVIAPVGIDPSFVAQNPILGQILKNTTVPKFNNKPEDYWDWKWNLGRACERIMQGKPMPESIKEIILESALPDNLVLEYQVSQRVEKLGSTAFLARLDDRFGKGQPMLARLKLERLELKNMGKLKAQDIKHFEVQFYDALKMWGIPRRLKFIGHSCASCLNFCDSGFWRNRKGELRAPPWCNFRPSLGCQSQMPWLQLPLWWGKPPLGSN